MVSESRSSGIDVTLSQAGFHVFGDLRVLIKKANAEKTEDRERNALVNNDHVSGDFDHMTARVNPRLVTAMVWASWTAIMLPVSSATAA